MQSNKVTAQSLLRRSPQGKEPIVQAKPSKFNVSKPIVQEKNAQGPPNLTKEKKVQSPRDLSKVKRQRTPHKSKSEKVALGHGRPLKQNPTILGNHAKSGKSHSDCDSCDKKKKKSHKHKDNSYSEQEVGIAGTCKQNCCTKIAFIDLRQEEHPGGLADTLPYIEGIRRQFYPSQAFETYFVPDIPASDAFPADGTAAEQDAWYCRWGDQLEAVTELVDDLVCRGFKYISLPTDSQFLSVWLLGNTIPNRPLHGGVSIDVAYPGVKFIVFGSGAAEIAEIGNLYRFSDVISGLSPELLTTNYSTLFGNVPPTEATVQLVYDENPFIEAVILPPIRALFVEGGPLFGATLNEIPISFAYIDDAESEEAAADLQSIAQAFCAANNNPGFNAVVAEFILSSPEDFIVLANEWDAEADPIVPGEDCPTHPPIFSNEYANVQYFNIVPAADGSIILGNNGEGVQVSFGLSVANGDPSAVQEAIGLPCDYESYQALVNFTFNPYYFKAYVWAANCEHVPQDVTGTPLRFHPGTRTVVERFLWNIIVPAGTTDQVIQEALFINPLYCAGGALGF